MNKVVTINLNNKAYQLEEAGYDALQKYLRQASDKLHDNPDRDEIMADFEQAVAEKCDQNLNDHKTVVTEKEIKDIITAMGPVEAVEEKDEQAEQAPKGDQPRRLYLIKEGSVIGGVCMGLSAYFNVDVTVVRIIFVILAVLTGGAWVAVYILMMLVMPEAKTPEEKAEARGYQFNAQELLGRAKQKYAELSDEKHWRTVAKEQHGTWQKVSTAGQRILAIVARLVNIVITISVGILTGLWVMTMWQFVWRPEATGLGVTNPVLMLAWLTGGYLTVIILLELISLAFWRLCRKPSKKSRAGELFMALVLATGVSVFTIISFNYTPQLVETINSNQQTVIIKDGAVCFGGDTNCLQTNNYKIDVR